jgi:uncharacterized PurR-regulated membrane protein YhhQ (DUF165 family)
MILIVLYLGAIVLANLALAHFGIIADIPISFLFIGLDLTTRDYLHQRWENKNLWRNMALLIATGSIISALLNINALPIAIASFVAFSGAGIADTIMYHYLGDKERIVRINGSNVISAGVDSFLFPALAFGFPLLLPIMIGEWIAKVGGGFIWSLVFDKFREYTTEED